VRFTLIAPGDRSQVTWPPLPAALAGAVARSGAQARCWTSSGVDVIGRSYAELVPSAEVEAQARDVDTYQRFDELWLTGATPFALR